MDYKATPMTKWMDSYLNEQRKLIWEFLSLQEKGVLPSYLTMKHMRGWILTDAHKAFLIRFQESAEGRNLYLVELTWKVRGRRAFSRMEQDVRGELHSVRRLRSSEQSQVPRVSDQGPMEGQQHLDVKPPSRPHAERCTSTAALMSSGDARETKQKTQVQAHVPGDSKLATSFGSTSPADLQTILASLVTQASTLVGDRAAIRQAAESVVLGLFKTLDRSKEDADAHASIQTALCDMEAQVTQRVEAGLRATVVPKQIVLHMGQVRRVVVDTLLLVDREACERQAVYVDASVSKVQALLWSFPWVQLTEEKQLANSLTEAGDVQNVTNAIWLQLQQVLGTSSVLARALEVGSKIFGQYLVRVATLHLAQQVPDRDSGDMEERRISQVMAVTSPLPASYTVSAELVEDFTIKFLLKLHPINGRGTKQLSQQGLLLMCLQIGATAFSILRKIPGVMVDEKLSAPVCNIRRVLLNYQAAMMKKCGSAIQLKKKVATRDPLALCTVPHAIVEGIFTIHQTLLHTTTQDGTAHTPCGPAFDQAEEAMEKKLFAHFLPESWKESMYAQFGLRVRNMKMFQRAFPPMTDADIHEYRCSVQPCGSARPSVWVDAKFLVTDDYQVAIEKHKPGNTVLENPLALECTKTAFLRQCPQTDIFEVANLVNFGTVPGFDPSSVSGYVPEEKREIQVSQELKSQAVVRKRVHFAKEATLPKPGPKATPKRHGKFHSKLLDGWSKEIEAEKTAATTQELKKTTQAQTGAIVSANVAAEVMDAIFRPNTFSDDEEEHEIMDCMKQHVHVTLQREVDKCKDQRLFLRNLERLDTPERLQEFARIVGYLVGRELRKVMPRVKVNICRLVTEPFLSLLVCRMVIVQAMAKLRPTVHFAGGTKQGDDTKFSVNVPLKREEPQDAMPPTKLEQLVERHRKKHLDELDTPIVTDEAFWRQYYTDLKEDTDGGNATPMFKDLDKIFKPKKKCCVVRLRDWLRARFQRLAQRAKRPERPRELRRDCFYSYYGFRPMFEVTLYYPDYRWSTFSEDEVRMGYSAFVDD